MHEAMAATLDTVVERIRNIQHNARLSGDLTRRTSGARITMASRISIPVSSFMS